MIICLRTYDEVLHGRHIIVQQQSGNGRHAQVVAATTPVLEKRMLGHHRRDRSADR